MAAFVMTVMNPIPVVACFLDGGRHLTKLTCNDFNEQLYRAGRGAVHILVVNFVLL
jgi:hypothetical protein